MPKLAITQSIKRFQESLASLFVPISEVGGKKTFVFLKSSTDTGVIRNGGRNGARFSPQSFLSVFKKLTQHPSLLMDQFVEIEVSDERAEIENFSLAQVQESEVIAETLKQFPNSPICHLGGGHDHVYPLLMALAKNYSRIVVLNIDAHADTRVDDNAHSGTPFRQFSESFSGEFYLFQVGLHPFANSQSTLSPLNNGKMSVLWREELRDHTRWSEFFEAMKRQVNEQTAFIFSLDTDALSAGDAPGVSAVNGAGLSRDELMRLWKNYKVICKNRHVMGIYEMNPVYDSLAMTTARTLSTFVYQVMT